MIIRILPLLFLLGSVGCVRTYGGLRSTRDLRHEGLGSTLVLLELHDAVTPDEANAAYDVLSSHLARIPGTTIVTTTTPADRIVVDGAPLSDQEAVARAKASGADSVVVLTVSEHSGRFEIWLLPPVWSTEIHLIYGLRVLDTASGRPIATGARSRRTGGLFAIMTMPELSEELEEDLQEVLRPVPSIFEPKKGESVRKGIAAAGDADAGSISTADAS